MDLRRLLLATAAEHRIREPDSDSGYDRFVALTGQAVSRQAFADAIATCVADRLVYDPVRLPEGALQCHWHLEVTEAGKAYDRSSVRSVGQVEPADRRMARMQSRIPCFDTFDQFIECFVKPRQARGYKRLDGQSIGHSRRIAARFWHQGHRFKVDEDSSIEALLRPEELASSQGTSASSLLVIRKTQGGKGEKLRLPPDISDDRGFYVYLERTGTK